MKLLKLVVLLGLVCLLASCSQLITVGVGGDSKLDQEAYLNGVREITSPDERDFWITIIRVAAIVDDSLFERLRVLNPTVDDSVIVSIYEDWKKRQDCYYNPETPYVNEYDSALQARVVHCNENDYRYYWPSGIWEWDERAVLVMKYGPPDNEYWLDDGECYPKSGAGLNCTRYRMEWNAPYRVYICQDRLPGKHPNKIIPLAFVELEGDVDSERYINRAARETREILERVYVAPLQFDPHPGAKVIRVRVREIIFPDPDSTHSVCVASMTRGDQFSRKGDSTFYGELVIYDSVRNPVYQETSQSLSLAVSAGNKAKDVWYPICLGGVSLPPGRYEAFVTFREGGTGNLGKYLIQFSLPTVRALSGMSEIMIYSSNPLASNIKLVKRNGDLFVPYLLGFAPGDGFNFYVEVESIPNSDRYEWSAVGTLHPIKDDVSTFVSPPKAVYDTLRREDKALGDKLRREYEKWEEDRKKPKAEVYFVYSLTEPTKLPLRSLTGWVDLPNDLPPGNYAFVLNIKEHITEHSWMAYYRITVRK